MKTRHDFVSNSSSSTTIVISTEIEDYKTFKWSKAPLLIPAPELGETEFGWQIEEYNGFFDKLNWCAIIVNEVRYNDKSKAEDMEALLKEVCAMNFKLNVKMSSAKRISEMGAYIDHQSSFFEVPDNARMFKDCS